MNGSTPQQQNIVPGLYARNAGGTQENPPTTQPTPSSVAVTSTDRPTLNPNHQSRKEESDGTGSSSGEMKTTTEITATSTSQDDLLRRLPDHVLRAKVLTYFGFKDYTLTGRACQYLRLQWAKATENQRLPLYVPEDCKTLKEAVKRVRRGDRLTTIVLGKGEHHIDGDYVKISSAMNIVGDPDVLKEEIVVVGGVKFQKGIQGNCHLQHMTLRQATKNGVYGKSSFTMEDVLVEQCGRHGVVAFGTSCVKNIAAKCTHVEVRQCGRSGVLANDGASMTLMGAKTRVHHNCTKGKHGSYGLTVFNHPRPNPKMSPSTIRLVSPLTKETVSMDNSNGGNWGGYVNQIRTTLNEAEVAAVTEKLKATGTMNVPEDCDLNEAVEVVQLVTVQDYFVDRRTITIVVGKGAHQVAGMYLKIHSALNIVGDPDVLKEEIVVLGGIKFKKGIQGNCHLQHMTIRQRKPNGMHEEKGEGVWAESSFTMEDVLVEQCGGSGVRASGTKGVGRCTNVEVRQCVESGVVAYGGGSMTLMGAKTTVHHNCTDGEPWNYGLAVESTSTIRLVSPLTKETVAVNNGGGGDCGACYRGDFHRIKTMTEAEIEIDDVAVAAAAAAMEAAAARGEIRMPEVGTTLTEAVARAAQDPRITTIVLGEGEYHIDDDLGGDCVVVISSAMSIVGRPDVPKEKIVVVGGIFFKEQIQGNCHLQHLTLRQAKGRGVYGKSSFTMEDVLVEQCVGNGVVAYGTGVVGRCTNVEVRQCGTSGVVVTKGGSITLIGAKTKVHHNCKYGVSDDYGLTIWGSSSSTIQLLSPLTKAQVSIGNGGGGNWGARFGDINQIKTVDAPAVAAVAAVAGETKSNH